MNDEILKPKAGDKYILQITSDHDDDDGWVAFGEEGLRFVAVDALESMTPYDEDRAFKDGQRDVWEAVKKAVLLPKNGGLFSGPEETAKALGDSLYGFLAYKDYDAFKAALDKAVMWSIGDEVMCDIGRRGVLRGVIVERNKANMTILLSDGGTIDMGESTARNTVRKTGRVYHDIKRLMGIDV